MEKCPEVRDFMYNTSGYLHILIMLLDFDLFVNHISSGPKNNLEFQEPIKILVQMTNPDIYYFCQNFRSKKESEHPYHINIQE